MTDAAPWTIHPAEDSAWHEDGHRVLLTPGEGFFFYHRDTRRWRLQWCGPEPEGPFETIHQAMDRAPSPDNPQTWAQTPIHFQEGA